MEEPCVVELFDLAEVSVLLLSRPDTDTLTRGNRDASSRLAVQTKIREMVQPSLDA